MILYPYICGFKCKAGFKGLNCAETSALTATIDEASYTDSFESPTKDMKVWWKVDGDEIEFAMMATTNSWVAIG
jgi:hypothetical protein